MRRRSAELRTAAPATLLHQELAGRLGGFFAVPALNG